MHQRLGFRRDVEIGKPRRKPRHAQDAHGVFPKGGRHMAQHFVGNILAAAIGIGEVVGQEALGQRF